MTDFSRYYLITILSCITMSLDKYFLSERGVKEKFIYERHR